MIEITNKCKFKEFNYESKLSITAGRVKYDNVLSSKWSPTEISGIIKVLNRIILKGIHKIQISENDQVIESEVSSYDNNAVASRLEIKNYNTLTYSAWIKSTILFLPRLFLNYTVFYRRP